MKDKSLCPFCFAYAEMTGETLFVRDEFVDAVRSNRGVFGLELSDVAVEQLADYYDLVQEHNPILHLVGPCTPAEFATRHVLESLTLLEFLPVNTRFADIGSGGGLPAIPCLIARPDIAGVLIESKEKKSKFLDAAVDRLGLNEHATIVNRQFSEVDRPDVEFITCRALDKFIPKLRQLVRWSGGAQLLFFGGPDLGVEMKKLGLKFRQRLMPMSERRFLYAIER